MHGIMMLFLINHKGGQITMFLIINIIGLLIFIGVAFLFSRDKKNIDWKSVLILIVINLV